MTTRTKASIRARAHGIRVMAIDTPLGEALAGATDAGVCLLEFARPAGASRGPRASTRTLEALEDRLGLPVEWAPHPHLTRLKAELREYFAGGRTAFTVPIQLLGTPFETRVWRALCEIPYGQTRSYADIARAIRHRRAVRAVGAANGRNRIVIVIPCHRVISASGGLGGYSAGLSRKRRLLQLETVRHV